MSWVQCPVTPGHPIDDDGRVRQQTKSSCSGCYFACMKPEHPHVRDTTCYDDRCRACMIMAEAAVCNGHGDEWGWQGHEFLTLGEWFFKVKERAL